jgi:choline-sulfatase
VEGAALRRQITRSPADATVAAWPASAEGDTATKNHALRFLEENRPKTFFAGVSFRKPHFPFVVQEEFYRLYQDRLEAPKVTPAMLADLPRLSQAEREVQGFTKLTDPQIRKARAVYFGMVTYMDSLIGEILKKVDELGLRENTIILYTADHGEMAGEHGLWYKNSFYEAAASVPLVLSFPKRITSGTKVQAPVMNMDLFPTLCDLCSVPKPEGLEGHSLLPLLEGKENGQDRYALSETFRGGFAGRMIRAGDWKYCYFHEDREQLFDLRNDPAEVVNQADNPRHKDLQASLKSRALNGWRSERRRKKQAAAQLL